jgi:putative ABC transport system permease protein
LQLDFIAPLENELSTDWNWRDPSYLLLDKQVSITDFKEKISGVFNERAPYNLPGKFKVGIMPIEEVHLSFGRRTYVYIFSAIAFFILFIACINYMNLATASSGRRFREVGLRKVVGARKTQLIYQFLGESLLLSLFAFVLSVMLAKLFLPVLNELTSKNLGLSFAETPMFFGYLLGLIFFVGILAGSYPAFYLTSCKPIDTLRSSLRFSSKRSVFRVISVVGQFTLSVLLIVCTAAVYKQLNYIQNRPLGFTTDHVLKIRNNPVLHRSYQSFKTELLRNPNISKVTRGQAVPYDEDFKSSVKWEGMDPNMSPNIRYSITDFDFFETFDMEVVQGRSFSNENPGDRFNYIINQTAVKYMGLKNPIGKKLQFWGHEGQIIGVVKDFHHVSFHREIMPHIFTINPQIYSNWMKFIFVKVSSENIPSTLRFIEETAQKLAPDYPFEQSFIDKGLTDLYLSEQTLGKIFTYFAFLAVFISCLGILGLSSFNAEKRTKEIGIRRILGSTTSGIVVLLSRQFTYWVLLANIIAWPIAYYIMHKWLQNFAYRTHLSFYLFLFAGITALAAAAIPILYQSLKAARVEPAQTLRHE